MQRRAQQAITIRSDRAAALLRQHTSTGRSQATVIEEALERLPKPMAEDRLTPEQAMAAWRHILATTPRPDIPTMAEFDAEEYDDDGLPR